MSSPHSRRNLRLDGYDYRLNGAYFVTVCAHQMSCIFGNVVNGTMIPNAWGRIAQDEWRRTETVRSNIDLDLFVVMPNHMHGILLIADDLDQRGAAAQLQVRRDGNAPGSLGQIIGHFKSIVTKRIRRASGSNDLKIWQRNYHDRIIRNEKALHEVRNYILANPGRWEEDSYFRRES